jgi:hypothetical protein
LPKARLDESNETTARGAAAPAPVNAIVTGVVNPLLTRDKVPVRVPLAVGENTTPTVQLASDAKLAPQVPPWSAKSPVTLADRLVSAAKVLALTLTTEAALRVPATVEPKLSEPGLSPRKAAMFSRSAVLSPLTALISGIVDSAFLILAGLLRPRSSTAVDATVWHDEQV